jgi:ABC-type nitrate/sulfonate/bicarbonate transport system substrate-binding protein
MTELKVIVFEGVQNLPLFAALANGLFAGQGLDIDLTFTPDSGTLRNGLAEGRFDIAHTAVDNAIAMVELAHKDVAIVLGGDNGFNSLFFQPEIRSFEDLRGKTVLVDAPNTAFALVLYKILDNHGLKRGDYAIQPVGATPFRLARMKEDKSAAAAILNLPYRILGSRAGLKFICDAVSEIGPYLSTTGFVLRPWAEANADTLVRYIRAYVGGLRWALDPQNKQAAVGLLADRLRLPADIALEAYGVATAPATGLTRDAHVDIPGFANVLKLRASVEGQWDGVAAEPARYLDMSYHAKAIATMSQRAS